MFFTYSKETRASPLRRAHNFYRNKCSSLILHSHYQIDATVQNTVPAHILNIRIEVRAAAIGAKPEIVPGLLIQQYGVVSDSSMAYKTYQYQIYLT
jgi:hypothetical protein